jgi:starch synthase
MHKVPLLTAVTRLVPHKGIELLLTAFDQMMARGGQCLLLGITFDQATYEQIAPLQEQLSQGNQGRIVLGHDERLAHHAYAAADMLIIPSLTEPCGLTQMIAQRYGTVPLVRKTGGLSDSIIDVDHPVAAPSTRNGFIFEDPSHEATRTIIDRALICRQQTPTKWRQTIRNGLQRDHSWKHAANAYVALYST